MKKVQLALALVVFVKTRTVITGLMGMLLRTARGILAVLVLCKTLLTVTALPLMADYTQQAMLIMMQSLNKKYKLS